MYPVQRTTSLIPESSTMSNRYARNGRLRTDANTLGRSLTTERSREPTPPTRRTAVVAARLSIGLEAPDSMMGLT